MPLLTHTFGSRGLNVISHKQAYPGRFQMYAGLDVATAVDVINDLGFDTLTFLAVTVMVIPPFKTIRASPVSLLHFHFLMNPSSSNSLTYHISSAVGISWICNFPLSKPDD